MHDLEAARRFYVEVLGCKLGRESPGEWIDFDLQGHQLSCHWKPEEARTVGSNPVDGDAVPVRHFGLVLPWEEWQVRRDTLKAAKVRFRIEPHLRFQGQPGEQATMFFDDPSGNVIELKSFRDATRLFAR